MCYYTQLVFVRPGREEAFHEFENHVLRYVFPHFPQTSSPIINIGRYIVKY